jgi:hypothetical protein
MPDRRDPFDALHRPVVPRAPRPEFTASLRRLLEEELGMTFTDSTSEASASEREHGSLAMVHMRVRDADRAIDFFGELFGWDAERVLVEGHVSHYTTNTTPTIRLLDDTDVPLVVPNYAVADVGAAVLAVEDAGGRIASAEPSGDGGGWARGEDNQGLPLLVYRPGGYHSPAGPVRSPSGDVGLVFIRADARQAADFYGRVFGWRLERVHPDSFYFETVARVGVFDEAAAFGHEVTPAVTLYFAVDTLAPVLRRVEELGGHAGNAAQDMGPYFTAVCTDNQGTDFGVMATALGR